MALFGTIESIVYRNDENGYTVARLENDGAFTTIVGKFVEVQEGAEVKLEGKYEKTKYGIQYAFSSYEMSVFSVLLSGGQKRICQQKIWI